MRHYAILFVVFLMGILPVAVLADSGVDVSVTVGKREITVGDVVPLRVAVTHPKGWRVMFPTLEKRWGELEVREQHVPQIVGNADGSETTTQEIDVMYFRPEQVTTPELELGVADDAGNVQTVVVEPTMLKVKTVLNENDTTLRDVKPQAELWQLSSSPVPFVASVALAFTLLGGASLWAWQHRPTPDKRTPRERALDELRAIEHTRHLEKDDAKIYCVRVSNTLREYLAGGCGIPAQDLTTGELAQVLKKQSVPVPVATQVIHVLRVCDGVKFANDLSDMGAIKTLVQIVEQIVLVYPPAPEHAKREVKG